MKSDVCTFELIRAAGDGIHESDSPSKHEDSKVPILDVKMYVNEGRKVMYEFYAKRCRQNV